jgi:RNA polymerase sigma factor (sigma-70 family)
MPDPADDSSFEAWYRDSYRRVNAAVRLVTGDRALAEEAVDEAFARAFERWASVGTMDSPTGWTCVVARNALRAAKRAERRQAHAHRLAGRDHASPPTELAFEVWDAVRRLPRRQREVIALRYLAGLREREIAETLGTAPGTVARSLHDARRELGQLLGDPGLVEEDSCDRP